MGKLEKIKMKNTCWKGKNVFITGASGLVGSWLTQQLVDYGANVVCLIRDITPKSWLYLSKTIDKVTTVYGRLENLSVLGRALAEYSIDTVFHLGAQTIVGTAKSCPVSTFETNIKGTWNVLEACRNAKDVKRIVVASSDKAYGENRNLPYTEKMPLQGIYPYDCSKSCADLIAQMYHRTYKSPVGIARCGNFFGGGDLNFSRIVPGTILSAIKNENPVIRSDGSYVRDYIYVKDAVDAYLSLAEKLDNLKIQGEAFNFSNECHYTVLELVALILKLMKRKDLKPAILNEVSGEIKEQYLSTKKAHSLLGWKAKYDVEKGLLQTIDWYKAYFK